MPNEKHFVEDPARLVLDSLTGVVLRTPGLKLHSSAKVVYQGDIRSKVNLISGGGSGHEPAHASFVGEGMLAAAVCGSVFASPNASQIRKAIELVDSDKGTILVVKNYTGDVLNFGLAKERYTAENPSSDKLRMVIVGDDVAVGKTQSAIVGRRGLAGTVLVYKIAGALAERGASLDEVYELAQYVAAHVATIGVGAEHVHVPGAGPGSSNLDQDEIEIGMGIHNEPGVRRLRQPSLSQLITQLVDLLTNTTDPERSYVSFGKDDDVVLMVNNLGATSELELSGVAKAALEEVQKQGISVKRLLVGTYMTSLNMLGFSLTLLRLPRSNEESVLPAERILELLDSPSSTAASISATLVNVAYEAEKGVSQDVGEKSLAREGLSATDVDVFVSALNRACKALVDAEPEITRMDTVAGDGDCGTTLKAGAEGVLNELAQGTIAGADVGADVLVLARVAEARMGGTSGALYSIFFSALAAALSAQQRPSQAATPEVWAHAARAALDKLYTYTRARPPSRTLVDPLAAFVLALEADPADVTSAVQQAGEAAEKTRELQAKAGRAAYVEEERLKEDSVPDPGAWGVKVILEALFA